MPRFLILVGCFLVVSSWGCSEPANTPDEALREYMRSYYLGEDEKAWEMVAKEDRDQITAAHDGLVKMGVENPPAGHELMLARRVPSPYALKKLEVVGDAPQEPKKGDVATVKLEFRDGRVEHARLDHDGERWRVRLAVAATPPATQKTAPAGEP
jgi:hypothetical protein